MAHNIFISHSWAYSDAYEKLVQLLDSYPRFEYKDYSVPKNDPIHNAPNERALKEAIARQMQSTNVVLIMAGVYSTYSKWINTEIDLAKNFFSTPKPIIAIRPWDSAKTSTVVSEAADKIVGWNTASIVTAIRECTNERKQSA